MVRFRSGKVVPVMMLCHRFQKLGESLLSIALDIKSPIGIFPGSQLMPKRSEECPGMSLVCFTGQSQ